MKGVFLVSRFLFKKKNLRPLTCRFIPMMHSNQWTLGNLHDAWATEKKQVIVWGLWGGPSWPIFPRQRQCDVGEDTCWCTSLRKWHFRGSYLRNRRPYAINVVHITGNGQQTWLSNNICLGEILSKAFTQINYFVCVFQRLFGWEWGLTFCFGGAVKITPIIGKTSTLSNEKWGRWLFRV